MTYYGILPMVFAEEPFKAFIKINRKCKSFDIYVYFLTKNTYSLNLLTLYSKLLFTY